jgi:hypothetical protein
MGWRGSGGTIVGSGCGKRGAVRSEGSCGAGTRSEYRLRTEAAGEEYERPWLGRYATCSEVEVRLESIGFVARECI